MTDKTDMGGPAFPAPDFAISKEVESSDRVMRLSDLQGMTLWDYYAAHAIEKSLIQPRQHSYHDTDAEKREAWVEGVARDAALIADAMLAERTKRTRID